MKTIKGIIPPMITPLKGDDQIDREGTVRLTEHILAGGVHALFLLGTTGEAQSLSYKCRYDFVELVCRQVAGRVPVLVGVTDTSLDESVKLAAHAAKCGAVAVVAAAPYYFAPSQQELIEYYTALADALPLPLFLYNMPSHVKVFLEPATVKTLAEHPNIVGLKDSSANMTYFQTLLYHLGDREDFALYVGPEELTGESVVMGADGGVNGEGPGYMVCANHVSFIDIFILDAVLPCRFVAKKEIASWPVFGFIARGTGTLFIARSRKRAVLEIADAMAGAINEGTNVLFFPEGTTGNGLELLPFHPNLFEAAVRSGAQILPVTLRYTLDGKPSGLVSYAGDVALFTVLKRILFTPGLGVEVTLLDPISVDGKTRQALCLEASALMSGALGVSDVTAEREEARRRRLQAMSETKVEAEKTV